MVYILMVNTNMFATRFNDGTNPLGAAPGAIYIAMVISAIVGTVLAGLMANLLLAHTVCIGFGLISYIAISVFCDEAKKIKPGSWVIAGLFVLMLLLTH